MNIRGFWWRLPESNWGHRDFQSLALPTELKRQHKANTNITILIQMSSQKSICYPFYCGYEGVPN